MKVDIYSDVVCPWCYLGKRRFEKALAEFAGSADVEIRWRPYQLDPDASEQAQPAPQALAAKFGSAEKVAEAQAHVTGLAAAEGLKYDLENSLSVNTLTAHRLVWWAASHGKQAELVERLFAAHFTEGANLGDQATLAALATEVGIEGAAEFLASSDGLDEVREEIGEARAIGVTAVPTFVFDEQWAVEGAQATEVFVAALTQVSQDDGGGGCCGGDCCGSA